jgi:hypothetical protein
LGRSGDALSLNRKLMEVFVKLQIAGIEV